MHQNKSTSKNASRRTYHIRDELHLNAVLSERSYSVMLIFSTVFFYIKELTVLKRVKHDVKYNLYRIYYDCIKSTFNRGN